jgi:hypothetical protein
VEVQVRHQPTTAPAATTTKRPPRRRCQPEEAPHAVIAEEETSHTETTEHSDVRLEWTLPTQVATLTDRAGALSAGPLLPSVPEFFVDVDGDDDDDDDDMTVSVTDDDNDGNDDDDFRVVFHSRPMPVERPHDGRAENGEVERAPTPEVDVPSARAQHTFNMMMNTMFM